MYNLSYVKKKQILFIATGTLTNNRTHFDKKFVYQIWVLHV